MEARVDTSRMKREIHAMPQYVAKALKDRGVTEAYDSRPAYQQNDYVWWITHAKREETRQKRLKTRCWTSLNRAATTWG